MGTLQDNKWVWLRPALWALLMFLLDGVWINQGVYSAMILLVSWFILLPLALLTRADPVLRRRRLWRVGTLTLAALAVFGTVAANNHEADRRFHLVVEQCRMFHERHGRFPDRLEELVPEFLPEIPPAKVLGMTGMTKFRYWVFDDPKRHLVEYVVFPPFGRRFMRLESMEEGFMD